MPPTEVTRVELAAYFHAPRQRRRTQRMPLWTWTAVHFHTGAHLRTQALRHRTGSQHRPAHRFQAGQGRTHIGAVARSTRTSSRICEGYVQEGFKSLPVMPPTMQGTAVADYRASVTLNCARLAQCFSIVEPVHLDHGPPSSCSSQQGEAWTPACSAMTSTADGAARLFLPEP